MSRVIRIDRDVSAVIKCSKKQGESNNSAVRRLLGIGGKKGSCKPKKRLT